MAVKLSLSCTQNSQSVANNTSNVTVKATASWTYGSWNEYKKPGYVIIDGTKYSFTSSFNANATTTGSQVIFTKTVDVKHNADGSKTLSYSGSYTTGVSSGTITASGSKVLTKIPRQANITAADNFTDEGNPTVTYSNPAGEAVDALEIALYNTAGSTSYASYRAASKTGTTYTFNLTDAERTALRKAATGNTLNVRFYLKTTIADVVYYSHIDKTMTITNGNPTLNPTVVDSNATTKALTGDANKLIKYFSNAAYTINAAALKNSTLASQKATHNGVVKTTATGTYNAVEGASFTFEAKDSRGNITTKTITKTLIDYVKLTCNQNIKISTDGVATININGNYFNGSFGTTANTLTVEYRYKLSGGTYSNWIAATATKSGNTYEATASIPGLNYQQSYVFQCRAIDKLATIESSEKTVKSLPVFDWGENDFEFNVPVKDKDGNYMSPIEYEHADGYGHILYGNGMLIQWGSVVITPTAANTITELTVNFPIAFDEVPRVKLDPQTQYSNAVTYSMGPATDSFTLYATRTTSAATRYQWEARGHKEVE